MPSERKAEEKYQIPEKTLDTLMDLQAGFTGRMPKRSEFRAQLQVALESDDEVVGVFPPVRMAAQELLGSGVISLHPGIGEDTVRTRADRLYDLINGSDEGWCELLKTMAEHPNRSVRNLLSITEYRIAEGIGSTQELLTFDEVQELGGIVARGSHGVTITRPKFETAPDGRRHATGEYEYERLFAAEVCRGLDPKRYRKRPMRLNPESPESMDMFERATAYVDIDDLDPIGAYVVGMRYGSLLEGSPLPARPEVSTASELISRLESIQERASSICARVDRELTLARHPDWVNERDMASREREARVVKKASRPVKAPTGQAGAVLTAKDKAALDELRNRPGTNAIKEALEVMRARGADSVHGDVPAPQMGRN